MNELVEEDVAPRAGPVQKFVQDAWDRAFQKLETGLDIESDILLIEHRLRRERSEADELFAKNKIDNDEDVFLAEALHAHRKGDVLPVRMRIRENEFEVFGTRAKLFGDLWSSLNLFGIKTLLVAHGSIAIAAIAGLVQSSDSTLNLMLAFLISASTIGAIAAAFGLLIVSRFYARCMELHEQVAVYRPGQDALGKIRAKLDKLPKKYQAGDLLLYGSLGALILSAVTFSSVLVVGASSAYFG